ncbi:MAG TPA: low temperature requirement protein A [Actinomycetota bacterium]|nr:low temperature requirement protein A [Actinomycetota bacterium]
MAVPRPRRPGLSRAEEIEDDRVTAFELFFDLAYVFAATQVTGCMAREHSGHGVVRGMLLLALLWWTWSAHAWLGEPGAGRRGCPAGGHGRGHGGDLRRRPAGPLRAPGAGWSSWRPPIACIRRPSGSCAWSAATTPRPTRPCGP